MSVPPKYKALGDFHEYYSGMRTAPYLTIFVGGNHEACNYMSELYYGGWVAPNIYYLGAANVIRYGPLRIAGMSGIWKGYDYRKPHHERLPYNRDDIQSLYHIRELDVRKLLQIRTQVDVALSHDWPKQVEYSGDYESLFRVKRGFGDDSAQGKFGSVAAKYVFDRLRPGYWFASHLHVKFSATAQHGEYIPLGSNPQKESGPPAAQPQAQPPLGMDGAVIASMIAGEDQQANDDNVPETTPAETSTATLATPIKTIDDKAAEASSNDNKNISTKAPGPSAADATTSKEGSSLPGCWPSPPTNDLGNTESRLSAWNSFHDVATKREREENARLLAEQSNQGPLPEVKHNLTWKRVNTDDDGINRKIIATERPGGDENRESKKLKTQHVSDTVNNSDEINLDVDSDSDRGSPAKGISHIGNANKNGAADRFIGAADDKGPEKPRQEPDQPIATPSTGVSETLRSQLPASFARPEPSPEPAADVSTTLRNKLPASFARPEPAPGPQNGPLPAAISNKTTSFLALDKCVPNRDFLQLVELDPISDQENAVPQRPYRLQYDKEWLAISRVFADDLEYGNPRGKVPADKGDVVYKPLIEKEENWIEEHVVKPGKLDIPENFTPTAPFYDSSVPITTEQQPIEYTNPQTSQFCELIGIENKFHLSDEERQARMNAGARPSNARDGGFGYFNRRSAGSPNKGGGGNRGRGWGRGGGGGRGRGRGRGPRY